MKRRGLIKEVIDGIMADLMLAEVYFLGTVAPLGLSLYLRLRHFFSALQCDCGVFLLAAGFVTFWLLSLENGWKLIFVLGVVVGTLGGVACLLFSTVTEHLALFLFIVLVVGALAFVLSRMKYEA